MTAVHYQAYMVAWDWLLMGLYALILLAGAVGVAAILFVEWDNRRRPK